MISPPSKSWALNTLALMKSGCSAKFSTNFNKQILVRLPAALTLMSLQANSQLAAEHGLTTLGSESAMVLPSATESSRQL